MQYPLSWDKNLNISSPDVVTFYPSAVKSNASLTVTVDDISDEKGIPLAQYASDSNDAIKNRTHDFKLVESNTNNTLAGLPTYKSVYTYAGDNNSTVQGMEIGAIKGDKVYIFTYEAEPNEYLTYLPMIKKHDLFISDNEPNITNKHRRKTPRWHLVILHGKNLVCFLVPFRGTLEYIIMKTVSLSHGRRYVKQDNHI